MKGIVVIIDGLGDLPVPELSGQTPLEAASTPVLDRLATAGRYGLLDPIAPGETPSTYSGVGTLFGMHPSEAALLGRGPVEAAGLGLTLAPGDVAMRVNFATVSTGADGLMVLDRRAGRINDNVGRLASSVENIDLGPDHSAHFQPTHQHRGVLVLSGPSLSAAVSDTDPGDEQIPAPVSECVATAPGGEKTAQLVNRFVRGAHERLAGHPVNRERAAAGLMPANALITRGAGMSVALDNALHEAGLSASVVTGCNTVRGLARLFGFGSVDDARFTGDLDTDLPAKFAAGLAELERHDIVYVHIKAPDICAHDRRPLDKRDFLERVDAAMAILVNARIVLAVAADHTTDSNSGSHTDDPVPALLCGAGERAVDAVVKFSEAACRSGTLPRQTSRDFLLEMIRRLH